MNQPKKRRKPRIKLPESTRTNWREKVHAFFVRMLEYNNRVAKLRSSPIESDQNEAKRLTQTPPRELIEEADRMHDAIAPSERAQHDAYGSGNQRPSFGASKKSQPCWVQSESPPDI